MGISVDTTTLELLLFINGVFYIICHVSKSYFLKAKLLDAYKDSFPFVSTSFVNECTSFVNKCFIIDCVSSSFHVIFQYWYTKNKQLHQITRTQWEILHFIYIILILTLFNANLYKFILFTMRTDRESSSQINYYVTKQI